MPLWHFFSCCQLTVLCVLACVAVTSANPSPCSSLVSESGQVYDLSALVGYVILFSMGGIGENDFFLLLFGVVSLLRRAPAQTQHAYLHITHSRTHRCRFNLTKNSSGFVYSFSICSNLTTPCNHTVVGESRACATAYSAGACHTWGDGADRACLGVASSTPKVADWAGANLSVYERVYRPFHFG